MTIERRHFEQLKTPESWHSPLAVIAHIDLDAFYAQCLGVYHNIDPAEPLGCRQWNALIAINYPARKFELKRGVSVLEAQKLCPGIHLPHVATFKKGDLQWEFHDDPDPNNYKVSLDFFRRESRKIFAVFKEHFAMVEKAGIDEGFMDIGQEVHREVLRRWPGIANSELIELTHDDLLDIGGELVNAVRLEIHSRLKYTCSAGIAANKQLAKLGSGYNKPFNQTVVHISKTNDFLANFKITDAWGWGGKLGKEVIQKLKITDEIADQCEYVRDNFSMVDLQHLMKGDVKLARNLYELVRGSHSSELRPNTLVKSMIAVKDFRRLDHLETREDVESWLRVFSADLSCRLFDLQEEMGCAIGPRTISVKHFTHTLLSKQQPYNFSGSSITQFREQIYNQSRDIAKSFVSIPCTYLVVEISHLHILPKERLSFQTMKERARSPLLKETQVDEEPGGSRNEIDEEELLFVENSNCEACSDCGKLIAKDSRQEHEDWHFAKDLQSQDRAHTKTVVRGRSRAQQSGITKSSPRKKKKKKPDDNSKGQKSIFDFFEK